MMNRSSKTETGVKLLHPSMPVSHLQKANKASAAALLNTSSTTQKSIKINDSNYVINIVISSEISSETKEAIWEMFKINMESLYKSTEVFAWNPSEKKLELFDPSSRFIIIYPEGGDFTDLIAFTMFRFEKEDDAKGRPQNVLYCYEAQVDPRYQGNGLGAILVSCLIKLANGWHMRKVMLTVFSENQRAIRFYQREGFTEDEISPDDEKYIIMSTKI